MIEFELVKIRHFGPSAFKNMVTCGPSTLGSEFWFFVFLRNLIWNQPIWAFCHQNFVTKISSPEWWYVGNFYDRYKKFKVLKLISSNIELGLCWICDAAHVLEFLDIQEFLTNRNNTNNTSDFYQICQSHIRSLFWVFYNIFSVKIQKEFTGT